MLIGGIVLIVIALGVVFFERRQTSRANAAKVTETLSCGDIDMLARGVESEVGGGFHQRCEVIGQAEPGEGGAVKAPHSGVDVVWHRSLVTHRYWEMEERVVDGQRQRNRVERSEEVSDITSSSPFVVRDASGT